MLPPRRKPQVVIDALVNYYSSYNANIHRGIHTLAEEATLLLRLPATPFKPLSMHHPEKRLFLPAAAQKG
jgi:hypothetical protein